MGLLKSPLQQNTLNTLGFSRGTCHDRHLEALREVNYGLEGMGLPNKEDRRTIGPAVAEISASQKRFSPGRAGPLILRFSRYYERASTASERSLFNDPTWAFDIYHRFHIANLNGGILKVSIYSPI